ncbi:MAG: pseudouridine-5'-phosphate glycosidase [Bacteriovoracaceae bacterium]|nr:pseudouridine-5'-phosphate glycosidase [Bacteriovoracaceae bacterium]
MIKISQNVAHAIKTKQPIVALESTIITHGLPFPQNYDIAIELEKIAESKNVVPATIAILDGKIKIGLSKEEINLLAKTGAKAQKLGVRDIPLAIMKNDIASTTVAATIFCAEQADILVFATGGIGGVHKVIGPGIQTPDKQITSFLSADVSNDLEKLASSNMIVVSAGAKAILDLNATLEYLETKGVSVIGYQTNDFPAFYSRSSGIALSARLDTPEEIATLYKLQQKLQLNKSILIANPIPHKYEISHEEIGPFIQTAIDCAYKQNIRGKNLTPYLLNKLALITKEKSVASNLSLIKNNVTLACDIALAL